VQYANASFYEKAYHVEKYWYSATGIGILNCAGWSMWAFSAWFTSRPLWDEKWGWELKQAMRARKQSLRAAQKKRVPKVKSNNGKAWKETKFGKDLGFEEDKIQHEEYEMPEGFTERVKIKEPMGQVEGLVPAELADETDSRGQVEEIGPTGQVEEVGPTEQVEQEPQVLHENHGQLLQNAEGSEAITKSIFGGGLFEWLE
jgi:hypothetical protein